MPDTINRFPAGPGYVPQADANGAPQKAEGTAGVGVGAGVAADGTVTGVLKIDQKDSSGSVSKPEIPPVKSDKVDWSKFDAQSILAILGLEQNKRGVEASESDIKLSMAQQKESADARLKSIEEATKKAQEAKAKENSFWGKFCKVLSGIASAVGSVASFALGAMLVSTGVGSVAGVLLMAYSVSSRASTVMDTLVGLGAIDDPGWRPTIASGVSKGLEACGVDPKIAGWIGVATEIGFAIAVNVSAFKSIASEAAKIVTELGPVFSEKFAAEMAKTFTTTMTLGKFGSVGQIGSSIVKAGGDIGTQTIKVQTANLQYESDMAAARAEEIKAAMARLAKTIQMDMETVETLIKRMQAMTESVSETVQGTAEANKSIARNMGATAA